MSDDMDAALGAAFDSAAGGNGTSVIDAGESIAPPDHRGPERDDAETGAEEGVNWDASLARAWDRAHEREQRQLERKPPMPGLHHDWPTSMSPDDRFRNGMDATLEAGADWQDLPLTERRLQADYATKLQGMIDAAKRFGIECKTAADVQALHQMLGGQKKSDGNDATPAPAADPEGEQFFASHFANVKPEERWKHLDAAATHYAGIEKAFAADPVKAGRELMIARGKHPMSLASNDEVAELLFSMAAPFISPDRMNDFAAYVWSDSTSNQQQELQQRHWRADATAALVDEFGADRPDFDELLPTITKLIETKFKGEKSRLAALEKAYNEAKRQAAKQPRKPALDKTIEAAADRHYGAAAA